MKRKVFFVLVVGVLLAATASMSYARGPGRGMNCCPRWDCPRSYGYQWDYQWNAPQMGPGRGRMGPQMGPGQMPQNPQMRQDMYARNWELRNQIGEKLQERAWLLRQDPVDQGDRPVDHRVDQKVFQSFQQPCGIPSHLYCKPRVLRLPT